MEHMELLEQARQAARRTLERHEIAALPVKVAKICREEGIKLITYKEGATVIRRLKWEAHTVGNSAFVVFGTRGSVIFFDDTTPREQQRMDVAHEIGHVVLDVLCIGLALAEEEAAADAFMEELLMPSWAVSPGMKPGELAALAKVSEEDARRRLMRARAERRKHSRKRSEGWHGRAAYVR